MEPTPLEQLLIARFDKLEDKIDKVRTEDLPKIKEEVAILVEKNKSASKFHSFVGSIAAIVISAAMPHR